MAAESARRQRQRATRRRRAIAGVAGIVVAGAGSAVAYAASEDSGARWQTATVGYASITQTVETSGTVSASGKTTASFAQTGTVATVPVAVGKQVAKGDVVATLDTTALRSTLDQAESTVATDKQRREADETGQTGAGDDSATTQSATVAPDTAGAVLLAATTARGSSGQRGSSSSTGSSAAKISALVAGVRADQGAVIDTRQAVDKQQQVVDAARDTLDRDAAMNAKLAAAQQSGCAADTATGATAPISAPCSAAMTAYQGYAQTITTASKAVHDAVDRQDTLIGTLDASITKLGSALTDLTSAVKSGSGSGGAGSGSSGSGSSGSGSSGSGSSRGSGSASGTGSGSGSARASGSGTAGAGRSASGASGSDSGSRGAGSSASTQPASAAQLAADQAAIDAAEQQVTVAEQNLTAATLRSPVAGTVAAVSLTAGASSSGGSVTVLGAGPVDITTTVPIARIDQVKAGQAASVTVDGRHAPVPGTVRTIGLLSTTSGSGTTFPVTVQLAGAPDVRDGTGADVTITTGRARHVAAVPNSALTSGRAGAYTVQVLKNGRSTPTAVTLGVTGADVTQVTRGLKIGQQVVLADLSTALPSSSTSSSTSGTTRFGGGFGTGGGAGTGGGRFGGR